MTDREHLEPRRRRLCALQSHLRDVVIAARRQERRRFAQVAAVTPADTIYRVDRIGEEAIAEWLGRHWPAGDPVQS